LGQAILAEGGEVVKRSETAKFVVPPKRRVVDDVARGGRRESRRLCFV
jgi:hypothetical protein